MSYQPSIRHFLLLSSLYLLSTPLQAQTAVTDNAARSHQSTQQAKVDFIADFDQNGDGSVSYSEFFQSRQQRLAAMDIHGNAQITAAGYQAEYADRLDQRLALDRSGQLKQTEVRFASVDTNKDGRMTLAEYQASGQRAFDFIDQNKDGVISKADPAPQARRQQAGNVANSQAAAQPQIRRRPALVMPTTHSADGMLAMYDQNADGIVSPAEYQQRRAAVFQHTDSDQNGELSPAEYMNEFTDRVDQQITKTRDAQLKQALVRFKALDKDENGVLSAPEYHQSGQRMFARWDTDHNRQVTLAEALPAAQQQTAAAQQRPAAATDKPADSTANTESPARSQASSR
jgi:Ca2+-binding EF-hand superfamily protein